MKKKNKKLKKKDVDVLSNRRLCLFLFRDDEGVVYEYVRYLLLELSKNVDKLCIIVNGGVNSEGICFFESLAADIVIRPDINFDIGGWKYVICEKYGFEYLVEFEEIVLVNDSFFGPFCTLEEVFNKMSVEEIDFWGLTAHGASPSKGICQYEYRPRYLQSYFLVFRNTIVKSKIFQKYWENLNIPESFALAGEAFSCTFTKLFEENGFKWSAYVDTSDLESEDINKNMSFHTFYSFEMCAKRGLPILKRKAVVTDKATVLRYNYGDEINKTLRYIDRETSYDTAMIYDYLIRKENIYNLKYSLNLQKIISDEKREFISKKSKVLIAHLYYEDLFDYAINFLKKIPKEVDLVITIGNKEKERILISKLKANIENKFSIILVEERGRDMSALLVGCKDIIHKYNYVGFIHDKKSVAKEYITVGASFSDILWENMLYDTNYINNIFEYMEMNEHIGLLCPPNVSHGTYFSSSKDYWTINFDIAKSLASSLGINSVMERNIPPIAVGTAFWCKSEILKKLVDFNWEIDDFPLEPLPGDGSLSHALERILPYAAQDQGLYTVTVMNTTYASAEMCSNEYMLNTIKFTLSQMPKIRFSTFFHTINSVRESIKEFNKLIAISKQIESDLNRKKEICFTEISEHIKGVQNSIGLKGTFVKYLEKKGYYKFFIDFVRRIVRY